MAAIRHRRSRWYDVEQAVKLLLGLIEVILELIKATH